MARDWNTFRHSSTQTYTVFYGATNGYGHTSAGVSSGTISWMPFVGTRNATVVRATAVVVTGKTGGFIRGAIYQGDGIAMYPSNLVLDVGCFGAGAASVVTNSINAAVVSGALYWLATFASTNGLALNSSEFTWPILGAIDGAISTPNGLFTSTNAVTLWPAPAPLANATGASGPLPSFLVEIDSQ